MRGKWFENFDFPILGSKIKIVVNLLCDLSKPIRRKIEIQWKKNQLNSTYLVREKSQIPSENTIFAEMGKSKFSNLMKTLTEIFQFF